MNKLIIFLKAIIITAVVSKVMCLHFIFEKYHTITLLYTIDSSLVSMGYSAIPHF
jgi:hypothetical protein